MDGSHSGQGPREFLTLGRQPKRSKGRRPSQTEPEQQPFHTFYSNLEPGLNFTLPRVRNLARRPLLYQEPDHTWPEGTLRMSREGQSQPYMNSDRTEPPYHTYSTPRDLESGSGPKGTWQSRVMDSENYHRQAKGQGHGQGPPGSGYAYAESSTGNYYSLAGSAAGSTVADSGIMSQSDQSSLPRQSTNSRTIALPPPLYANNDPSQAVPYCSGCNGLVPPPILETIPELSSLKPDTTAYWNYHQNFHYPVQRNNSIGGFTLNGQQDNRKVKTGLSRFCSSHKIALVVSTFSLLVTIGLVITLFLMKNMGMMEPM